MHNIKKLVVKSKSRSPEELIDEAVNGVDEFTDRGIKLQILGLQDEEPEVDEEVDEYEVGHEEPDGDEDLDEDTLRKLLLELKNGL